MKKLLCWLSFLTALTAIGTFLFYFFKINPQFSPCKKWCCEEAFEEQPE